MVAFSNFGCSFLNLVGWPLSISLPPILTKGFSSVVFNFLCSCYFEEAALCVAVEETVFEEDVEEAVAGAFEEEEVDEAAEAAAAEDDVLVEPPKLPPWGGVGP